METYPQQHEPWRPDYPPVWNFILKGALIDVLSPESNKGLQKNIRSFREAVSSIDKAMKS